MAALKQVLELEPSTELVFRGPFDKLVTVKLKLSNPSEDTICFKLMTTTPSQYFFLPSNGKISPNQSAVIHVLLQPFNYDENQTYKHKLMVRSICVRDEVLEDCMDKVWKKISQNAVMVTKLNCRLIPGKTMESVTVMEPYVATKRHADNRHLVVAGIDIGNTYTKCALSFLGVHTMEPTDIIVLSGLCSTEYSTEKSEDLCKSYSESTHAGDPNPTVLYLDDNMQLDSFEAIDKYMKHRQGHIFSDIKQFLYHNLTSKSIDIIDESDRQIPAVEVLAAIMNRIKDYLRKYSHPDMHGEDIRWVVAVPAVFTDQAVILMKKAIMQAGITEESLSIVFEPVAALKYCELFHKYRKEECIIFRPGGSATSDFFTDERKYVVVDIGGETMDVTVLQKNAVEHVTELNKVCFHGTGFNSVHKALDNVLSNIVGTQAYHQFHTEEKSIHSYWTMHTQFFKKLKNESIDSNTELSLKLDPLIFSDDRNRSCFKIDLGMSPYAAEIKAVGDKLRLSASLWKRLVADCCLKMVDQLKGFITENSIDGNIGVLLVGECADMKILQEVVIKEFQNYEILVPRHTPYATVSGAVKIEQYNPLSTITRAPVKSDTLLWIEDDQSKTSNRRLDIQANASDFVGSVERMSLSSDCIEDKTMARSSKLQTGLKSLSQRMNGNAQQISVRRDNIINDVLDAYKDLDVSRPLQACFLDEDDRDITKVMFVLFWENVCSVWFRGENAAIPLVPVAKRAEARRVFPILGKILEHTLCILGQFPPQMCRSLILAIAHPDRDVDADLVLDDYLLYVPERESILLSQSLAKSNWSVNRKKLLARFFSVNKISLPPTQKSFREDLLNIAYTEIIDTPQMYALLMRRGISDFALKHFFDVLDTDSVRAEYEMIKPTAERVVYV